MNDWTKYSSVTWDELVDGDGKPRRCARALTDFVAALGTEGQIERRAAAERAIRQMGITFTVYSDEGNIDREWPFDIIPRVIDGREWRKVERGLTQRLEALNLFIDDLYNDQQVLDDGIVPRELIESSKNFLPQCRGVKPPHGVWAHICGSDLVRDDAGTLYVLEDNLRVPSGVSYMLENRELMKRTLPEVFDACRVRPIDGYPGALQRMLQSLSQRREPVIGVLTPGMYNSAYFEHAFLAQQIGAELVEGRDLVVEDDIVYVRNVDGLQRLDVLYRRVDDAFIDPEVFREDSTLGVAGLMRAWKAGNIAIANAPGAGVADDKVVYSYVPELIRYYLNEEPKIANVPTFRCEDPEHRQHVLAHLGDLVVKPANESGGYGMLIGPHSTIEQQAAMRESIEADPRNWIAQPTLSISTAPTLTDEGIEARHVDLRPFILQGEDLHVTTGGLTRVALVKGSLVVNSSQGGGSKDTWIVDSDDSDEPGDSLDDDSEDVEAQPVRTMPRRARNARIRQRSTMQPMRQSMDGPGGRMTQSMDSGSSAQGMSQTIDHVPPSQLMLSRTAENIYWLGRYLERAESTARLIDIHGRLLMDLPKDSRSSGWRSLMAIGGSEARYDELHDGTDERRVCHFLIASREHAGSLLGMAEAIHFNLRAVRDTVPAALYERINELCLMLRAEAPNSVDSRRRSDFLSRVEHQLLAIAGMIDGSMSRDRAWLVMRMGYHLERADMTSRVLDVRAQSLPASVEQADAAALAEREWVSVLRSLVAFRMYRQHVNRPVRGSDVLSYLMLDEDLPRAYRYCLERLQFCLGKLGRNEMPLQALQTLVDKIDRADMPALARDLPALHGFIDELQIALSSLGDAIATTYFPPADPVPGDDEDTDNGPHA